MNQFIWFPPSIWQENQKMKRKKVIKIPGLRDWKSKRKAN